MNSPSRFSALLLPWILAGVGVLPVSAQSGAETSVSPDAPARLAPPAVPRDEFTQMDTDGDGRISAAEYAASPREALDEIAAGKRRGPANLKGGFDLRSNEGRADRSKYFRQLDTNHDGYLSRDELDPSRQPAGESPRH